MKFQLVVLVLREMSAFILVKEAGEGLPSLIETLRIMSATVKPFSNKEVRLGGRRTVPFPSC